MPAPCDLASDTALRGGDLPAISMDVEDATPLLLDPPDLSSDLPNFSVIQLGTMFFVKVLRFLVSRFQG
jgi:hypothetical protein